MSVKLIYKDIAVGADEDASMSATGQDSISALALLPFGDENLKPYTTLEHNMWLLDGTKIFYDGDTYAFWSEEMSDSDGYFAAPPEITATMDEQYSSFGIYLDFGAINYCNEVEIIWYQGNAVLAQKTFYPNAYQYFCAEKVEAYNKVVIRLVRTALPYRRARLNGIYFGVTRVFKRDELRSVRITQQINAISREMPENVLDWQLDSTEALDYMFQLKQPVEAYDGNDLMGVFFVKSSDRRSERVYNISCTDAIGVLDEEYFPYT